LKQVDKRIQRAADIANVQCYKRFDQIDREQCKTLRIFVDKQKQAVVFPIYGMAVPFHISHIKSVHQGDTEMDGSTSLRVNFDVPPVSLKPEHKVRGDDLVYLKELNYKSKNLPDLQLAVRKIKELKKRVQDQRKDEAQMKGECTLHHCIARRKLGFRRKANGSAGAGHVARREIPYWWWWL
jgi:nucleosome binding factor SPN SPT16 subunit